MLVLPIFRNSGVPPLNLRKTLFITTGSFTQAAKKEAEVFPRIDLVDGDTLADKMADLGLGVLKDQIVVDYDYFAKFEASVARDQGQ